MPSQKSAILVILDQKAAGVTHVGSVQVFVMKRDVAAVPEWLAIPLLPVSSLVEALR